MVDSAETKEGRQVQPHRTVGDGRKTVTAAATAEALSSTALHVDAVVITAETNNTGMIVVGGSTVVAAVATRRGTPLNPGDHMILEGVDLATIYIDSAVNGDGVTYSYVA